MNNPTDRITIDAAELDRFSNQVLQAAGLNPEFSRTTTKVLLDADRRDIPSHGVARLPRYVRHLRDGTIRADAVPSVIHETETSILIDGNGGMGPPIAQNAMHACMEKSAKKMMGMATVRNSNHFGIAGHYADMALERGMIGIAMTNAAPLVVPTFGSRATIGTNPLSVSIPSRRPPHFRLDMATSTVPRGKLEVFQRMNMEIPPTWATDSHGNPDSDPGRVMDNMAKRQGGGLLPLGGAGERDGGHKGFNLGMLVEIFCGVLSGGALATELYSASGQPSGVCHFFAALNPAAFCGLETLQSGMERLKEILSQTPGTAENKRIWIAGEKEAAATARNLKRIPLDFPALENLRALARELEIPFPDTDS